MPRSQFSEQKITETVVYLLSLSGGRMNYLKLLKLLYYADREAFQEWERPITYDNYVSMKHGPVLSTTYDLIKGSSPTMGSFWSRYLLTQNHDLIQKDLTLRIQKLSPAEMELLHRVFDRYKNYGPFQLRDLTHQLQEYRETVETSIPITVPEILSALEYAPQDIERIVSELNEEASIASMFGDQAA